MSDSTNLLQNVKSLDAAALFDGFSRVILHVTDELSYTAGTTSGRTLEVQSDFGTQKAADDILRKIQGYQYQPYKAGGAILDPASELGDGVAVSGLYGGIFKQELSFARDFRANLSAPADEEIDHEYPYKPKQVRKVTRQFAGVTAELKINADQIRAEVEARLESDETFRAALDVQAQEIAAKVEKTGGDASSFGWSLLADSFRLLSGSREVFRADENGVEITGKITATSGKIGGFDILSNRLSYNNQTWGGTNSNGIYLGPSGIQLGKKFSVDSAGNLRAASGTFEGNVYAGNIKYGGDYGSFSGSGLESHSVAGGRLQYGTVSTSYTSSGINTSLGYANYANDAFNGNETPGRLIVGSLTAQNYFYFGNVQVTRKQVTVSTPGGGSTTIVYLAN